MNRRHDVSCRKRVGYDTHIVLLNAFVWLVFWQKYNFATAPTFKPRIRRETLAISATIHSRVLPIPNTMFITLRVIFCSGTKAIYLKD